MKIEISICTGLMLNDHSNPYIESTTVRSDNELILLTGPFWGLQVQIKVIQSQYYMPCSGNTYYNERH